MTTLIAIIYCGDVRV